MHFRRESAPSLPTLAFAEVEALVEAGQGWDLLFNQLGRGDLNARMGQVCTPCIDVVQLSMGNSVHQAGAARKGYRTFALVESGCPGYQWCGQAVEAGYVMPIDPMNGYESFSPTGFRAFSLGIEEGMLMEVAEAMQIKPALFARLFDSGLALVPGEFRVNAFLSELLDRMSNLGRLPEDGGAWAQEVERQICEDFIGLVAPQCSAARAAPLGQRAKLLPMAVKYIEEHAQEAVSVSAVCAATGVSVRTLERSFREHLGITPGGAIKKVRLEGVRKALYQVYKEKPINEIAGTWGFWHMGDFARDYLREYGELPKEVRK